MQLPEIIFSFLADLSRHNNREWFHDNRPRYREARQAFEDFTADFIKMVVKIDPSVGLPDVKDSIYRINRDIRFSADKSPYKTDMCCFIARGGKKSRLPGYYFSVEPGNSFMGGGQYCLLPDELKKVRREICTFPEDFLEAVENEAFRNRMYLYDVRLKKFPKGYEVGFKGDEYLKYKTFSSVVDYSDADCQSPRLAEMVEADLRLALPLNQFLQRAYDAPDEEVVDF